MFEGFDKKEKVNVEFQNLKFVIRVKDVKKTFDFFYIRFIVIIAPLNMFKWKKIDYLKKLIVSRLKYYILDYSSFTLYRKLVTRLR